MIKPKKSVQQLKPYINGSHSRAIHENHAKIIKLDSNESSVTPSPRVLTTLVQFIQNAPLNWYPDIDSTILVEKLAEYTGLPADFIQTFNGSDNALETICRTFIEPGDEVILCMPTYDHFRVYAESCDARIVPVCGDSPFDSDIPRLLNAVTGRTKMIYMVSPNNPTGLLFSADEIEQILLKTKDVLVIVDEAYFEFCGITAAPLTQKFANLVVTRSFSKAFGLAGLRCGYILTQPDNISSINKIRIGKNINSVAQAAAAAALDDLEYMESYVAEVKEAKTWLVSKLRKKGLTVRDTPANYILLEVAKPQEVQNFLEEQNVFVRDRSFMPQLTGSIRITIGNRLLMERFWKVFEKIPSSCFFTNISRATIQT
ncbi:MAG: histidinol-phosphate transaminase [Deltaproteobacteria bacterium]|nr:histidinol-phosphate transaminase [Deltaproteobacteria bacterium]